MALTKIDSALIGDGAITADKIAAGAVTAAKVAEGVAGGPKITNIQVTNNSYTVLDDTAVDLSGGYIKLTGTGFTAGCQVVINNTPATSTTFVSSTEVRAQVPAQSAGTYVVYLVNSDGGVAIRVNGITYSATPSWVTGSTLTSGRVDQAISIQLSATGAATYALVAGSSLPAGLTLTSGGLLSGTVTGLATETTYSFTIAAVDAENQDSPRTFSLTISVIVADPNFRYTTLLLQGNGTNGAQNNTFVDSSTNAFTITRSGNATQGTFSPFSPTGWSNFIGTNASKISITSAGTYQANGNYTLEGWVMWNNMANDWNGLFGLGDGTWMAANTLTLLANKTTKLIRFATDNQFNDFYFTSLTNNGWTAGVWYHIAFVRSGGSYRMYLNGEQSTAAVSATDSFTTSTAYVGDTDQSDGINGYVSNLRFTESAVYTSSFTPAATSLSAISGTKLLTCQSNRFVDNSATGATFTITNDVSVQAFSPFAPVAAWSAGTNGGSGYFDGTGDYLAVGSGTDNPLGTGDFTIEAWVYRTGGGGTIFGKWGGIGDGWVLYGLASNVMLASPNTGNPQAGVGVPSNSWNHVACVRSGNNYKIYINGEQKGSTLVSSNAPSNFNTPLQVATYSSGEDLFQGYISGARIVKGTAVYTTNFTPPTSPPTAVANTFLLLNSTNAGIYDATAKNDLETIGGAQISTAQSKFGGSSMYFDGTGDYLVGRNSNLLNLNSTPYTVEFWIYRTNDGSGGVIFVMGQFRGQLISAGGWSIWIYNGVPYIGINGGWNDIGGGSVSQNTWTHIAATDDGTTTRLFVGGTQVASSASRVTTTTTQPFVVGSTISGSTWDSTYTFQGYIDDIRITKGYARYTSNFTPPTSEFAIQ